MTNGIIDSGQKIVTNGLVLHLDAAQRRSYSGTGTTWTDLSGNGNNGTLTNGPTFNSANGGSISFDGVDDYVQLGYMNAFLTGIINVSASIWIKNKDPLTGIALSRYQNGTNQNGWFLATGTVVNNKFNFGFQGRESSALYISCNTDTIYDLNTWYNVSIVKENNIWSIYVNGVLVNSVTQGNGTTVFAFNNLNIGALTGLSNYLTCEVSSVQVYNRALSGAEVLQNYNATKARFEVPALLDLYPNAAAAYSLRKLRSGYTGSAIRVRRSSDNTEQDIGFTSTGDLDTTALTTFVGANNGFVTTWYDQSGNGNNATQVDSTAQPVIFSGGTVVNVNNKPAIDFDGLNDFFTTTNYFNSNPVSLFFITKLDDPTNTNKNGIFNANTSQIFASSNGIRLDNFSGNSRWGVNGTFLIASNTSTTIQLRSAFANSISNDLYVNNSLLITGSGSTPNFTSVTNTNIGRMFDSVYLDGIIQEAIIYNSNQSPNRIGIKTNINSYYGIYNPTVATTDTDAQAFITAAGITDLIQQGAINTLVKTLKDVNLWSKMKAIYPFVGGTAAAHKFNLKDPRDLDAAFRLVFNGGWTHSATGALPNGTTGWANTFLNPNTSLILNSAHISSYIRNTTTGMLMGTTVGAARLFISPNIGGTGLNFDINSNAGIVQTGNTNIGLWLGSRTLSNSMKLYNNINIIFSSNAISTSLDNNNIYLSARNVAGSASNFSSAEMGFSTIGDGLTDTEAANLYSAVQTFQTTLGRQV